MKIYHIQSKTSKFQLWKTTNPEDISDLQRCRDIKENYPIIVPKPTIDEVRWDVLTDKGYFYDGQKLQGNLQCLVIVSHEGITQLITNNCKLFKTCLSIIKNK